MPSVTTKQEYSYLPAYCQHNLAMDNIREKMKTPESVAFVAFPP